MLTYAKVHTCDFDVERNLTPGDDFYVAELDTSATCNYSGGVPDCNGGSSVFDGMVYLPSMEESRDTCILQAGKEEGVYLAFLNLEQLREYRSWEVFRYAYWHPRKYEFRFITAFLS